MDSVRDTPFSGSVVGSLPNAPAIAEGVAVVANIRPDWPMVSEIVAT